MVQKVNFNNLTGDTLTVGNTVINGTGVTVGGAPLSGGSGGATQYANTSQLPKQDLTFGEFALIGNTLFITNGVGWYSVALINQSPSLSISVSDITLGATGNTINFTYTATDPDGPTPTVTAELIGANTSQSNVTVYTANSTVTVENLSAEGYSANIVLTATDGIDQTFGTVTLNVSYLSELWDETVLSVGTSSTNSLDNSTFIDRSTNAHTVTPTGTPTQTAFHPYLDNWSVEFDGSGDYLTAPTSTDFSFDGDFTVESWVYLRSVSTSSHICDFRLGANSPDYNNIAVAFSFSTGTFVISIQDINAVIGTTTVLPNQWYHVAAVRNSNTITLYVNGLSEDSVVNGNTFANYTNRPALGAFGSGAANLNGYISNFRVIKGTALYTADFTPSTEKLTAASGTSLLTCQSNRFIDNSTNAHTITVNGDPEISAFNPFGQESEYAVGENKGSFYLDGDGSDYLTLANGSEQFVPEAQDFTFETWFYTPDNTRQDIYSSYTSTAGFGVGFSKTNSQDIIVYHGDTLVISTTGGQWDLNQWNHIAVSRDGTSLKVFINGVEVNSSTDSTDFSGTSTLYIGKAGNNTVPFEGYLSDLRFVKGTPVYTSNFTPPTSPVSNTNASLYLPFDNAGIFDKTGLNTLTPVGDTSTSTTQTKFADTAIYFDGSGDYLLAPGNNLRPTNSDFTLECWVYTSGGSTQVIYATRSASQNHFGILFGLKSNNQVFILADANGTSPWDLDTFNSSNGSSIPLNQWVHLAMTREGSTWRMFTNGVLNYTLTSSITVNDGSSEQTVIGGDLREGLYFNGYIENLQILKGVAKYTTNFTPPNRTQGRVYQAES